MLVLQDVPPLPWFNVSHKHDASPTPKPMASDTGADVDTHWRTHAVLQMLLFLTSFPAEFRFNQAWGVYPQTGLSLWVPISVLFPCSRCPVSSQLSAWHSRLVRWCFLCAKACSEGPGFMAQSTWLPAKFLLIRNKWPFRHWELELSCSKHVQEFVCMRVSELIIMISSGCSNRTFSPLQRPEIRDCCLKTSRRWLSIECLALCAALCSTPEISSI